MVTVFPNGAGAGAQSEAVHRGDEGKGILSVCSGQPGLEDLVATCFDLFISCLCVH